MFRLQSSIHRLACLIPAALSLLYTESPAGHIRFAAFGDYGHASSAELAVSVMVRSWSPDFIITTGDNSYGGGSIDLNIGQYYHGFIGEYTGSYGDGALTNRFFPSLGNHDYSDGGGLNAYLSYFTLPGATITSTGSSGTERYYDFRIGPVHFFAINSNGSEPDGNSALSLQANWLRKRLALSAAPWRIVYFHHAPYSSCTVHGSQPVMQWPFEQWGASAVLTGHDHTYERIMRDDNADQDSMPYFVTGIGGYTTYGFPSEGFVPGSAVRYSDNFGSMMIDADDTTLVFRFYSIASGGTLVDSLRLAKIAGCCHGSTGNVNGKGIVNLADLSALVAYLTGAPSTLSCPAAANVDHAGGIDAQDLATLVQYLINRTPFLPPCS
jgi:tartrate-resistant acid phosphatase type 5